MQNSISSSIYKKSCDESSFIGGALQIHVLLIAKIKNLPSATKILELRISNALLDSFNVHFKKTWDKRFVDCNLRG